MAFESNEVVSSTIEEKVEKKMKQRMAKPLKQFQTRVRKIIIGSGCGSVYHLKIGTRPGLIVILNVELKALGKLDE